MVRTITIKGDNDKIEYRVFNDKSDIEINKELKGYIYNCILLNLILLSNLGKNCDKEFISDSVEWFEENRIYFSDFVLEFISDEYPLMKDLKKDFLEILIHTENLYSWIQKMKRNDFLDTFLSNKTNLLLRKLEVPTNLNWQDFGDSFNDNFLF